MSLPLANEESEKIKNNDIHATNNDIDADDDELREALQSKARLSSGDEDDGGASSEGEMRDSNSPVNVPKSGVDLSGDGALSLALALLGGGAPSLPPIVPIAEEGGKSTAPIPFGLVPQIKLVGLRKAQQESLTQRQLEEVMSNGLIPKIQLKGFDAIKAAQSPLPSPSAKDKDKSLLPRRRAISELAGGGRRRTSVDPPLAWDGAKVTRSGWLWRQSRPKIVALPKVWKKNFCMLIEDRMELHCFDEVPSVEDKPSRSIDLHNCSIVTAAALTDRAHSFGLFQVNTPPIFFAAASETEMVAWIHCLEVRCLGLKTLLGAKIDDFDILSPLGKGGYGRVFKVRHRESLQVFAMKVVRKKEVIDRGKPAVACVKNERRVMAMLDHPFIVKMRYSFLTTTHLCFVMDLETGGELFYQIRQRDRLEPDAARFYAAEIVLALEYLHTCGIIYRDLKPENILISAQGHAKLTDFGFSRIAKGEERLYSVCGTPVYMAPEVVMEQGYGWEADWWSMGILLYEMLVGGPPFYNQNIKKCYDDLMTKPFDFPPHLEADACGIVRALCSVNPKFRLGAGAGGANEIKTHHFFRGFDWVAAVNMKLPAPWIPPTKPNEDDVPSDVQGMSTRLSTTDDPMLARSHSDSVFGDFEYNSMLFHGLTSDERKTALFGKFGAGDEDDDTEDERERREREWKERTCGSSGRGGILEEMDAEDVQTTPDNIIVNNNSNKPE